MPLQLAALNGITLPAPGGAGAAEWPAVVKLAIFVGAGAGVWGALALPVLAVLG